MNFFWLPDDARFFLFACMIIAFVFVAAAGLALKKTGLKQAVFYGFIASLFFPGLLFSARNDYFWLKFAENMHEKYGGYSSDEKFMAVDVQNWGVHEFFMNIRPYLKGDYRLVMPSLIKRSPEFPVEKTYLAKANFILRPFKPAENAPYLIVYDYDAVFDQQTGVLKIGDMEMKGLEAVKVFSKGELLLRRKQ